MRWRVPALCILGLAALFLFPEDAIGSGRNPGSCLLFPYYSTEPGEVTAVTLTNMSKDTIAVRLVWIDETTCFPKESWIELTGYDTYSFLVSAIIPGKSRGFFYTYVVDALHSDQEVDADVLIGQALVFGNFGVGGMASFSLNPAAFEALTVNGDGKLRLDGTEFESAPKSLTFPRFFGQNSAFHSTVALVNLTGGAYFDVKVEVITYNDNEACWSNDVSLPCFWYGDLEKISPFTSEKALLSSSHDPLEPLGIPETAETGWLILRGDLAWNGNHTFDHPSLYAFLIEQVGIGCFASRPWTVEDSALYNQAMLWSTNPDGT